LARVLSLFWIPAYAFWLASIYSVSRDDLWMIGLALRGIASLGVVSLAIIMIQLANAAELEDASRRISLALCMLPLPSILLASVPEAMQWIFMVVLGMVVL